MDLYLDYLYLFICLFVYLFICLYLFICICLFVFGFGFHVMAIHKIVQIGEKVEKKYLFHKRRKNKT
jgi:hypothetical protein